MNDLLITLIQAILVLSTKQELLLHEFFQKVVKFVIARDKDLAKSDVYQLLCRQMEEQEAEFMRKQKVEMEKDGGAMDDPWDDLSCSSEDSYYKG